MLNLIKYKRHIIYNMDNKKTEEKITQWKPGYRANILPEEAVEEPEPRHPMEKSFRRGKL